MLRANPPSKDALRVVSSVSGRSRVPSPETSDNVNEATSLHLLEQKRRAAALDYAPMDLGDFEVRIDFGVDCDEIVFATQEIEERAKVRVH